MQRAIDRQATKRQRKPARTTKLREYQRRWTLAWRSRTTPTQVPGVALLDERRLAMDPPPANARFAIEVLGITPGHWYHLRTGTNRFGWVTLRRILDRFPDLREPMNRGAFGRPADRFKPPSWVAEELPDLLARGEGVTPLPD
jgi:hypothetical protein